MLWLVVCSMVDQVVASLDRQHQDMRITVTRPLGSCAVMQVRAKEAVTACLFHFVHFAWSLSHCLFVSLCTLCLGPKSLNICFSLYTLHGRPQVTGFFLTLCLLSETLILFVRFA